MADGKKSFVLYADLIHTVRKLPKDKQAELFLLILEYVNDENPTTQDMLLEIAFEPVKQQLKRDLKRYEQVREKRSEAGKKSAESKKQIQQVLTNSTSVESVEHEQQVLTNSTDNVNDNDSVNVNGNVIVLPIGNELKNNNNKYACEALKNYIWCETVMMQHKLTEQTLPERMSEFERHLISTHEQKSNYKDFVTHFNNWLSKNPNKLVSMTGTNQRQPNYDDD